MPTKLKDKVKDVRIRARVEREDELLSKSDWTPEQLKFFAQNCPEGEGLMTLTANGTFAINQKIDQE